ncbi:MAG: TauD/TfdA family dioxygenase [Rhodospirillaceae bacterium]|jgi:taurine dioxygenase|nr:TauD/TfdA family dioxygenase [Rhodospirillaceae bacterium]MBT5664862.1 TauD/TfdA family dioxygenase [Rhodospirillaceae bacterium]
MTVSISPISDALGAEATGIDLTQPITDADKDALRQAVLDNLVLVIRDQHLNPEQYLAAVRLFGDTMPQHLTHLLMKEHPEIAVLDSRDSGADTDGTIFPTGSRDWHTDHTNHAKPPKLTALYAITLPKSGGGDTGFANMQKAFDNLPPSRKCELDGLQTINKIEDKPYVSAADKEKYGALQSHPLIRTHPETGRKAIYIHPGKVAKIDGMTAAESHEFVDELMDQVIQPDVTYRHEWRPGDLVIWDNRAIVHLAHRDYDHTEGRIMQRVLVKGDAPY